MTVKRLILSKIMPSCARPGSTPSMSPQTWEGGAWACRPCSLAAEELAQGCPATALAFNMHPCMVGPLMENPLVSMDVKQRLARLVVQEQRLAGRQPLRADHLSLLGTYTPTARARRVDGGYRITGRKLRLDD